MPGPGRESKPTLKVSEKPFDFVVGARTHEGHGPIDQGEDETEIEAHARFPDSGPVQLAQAEPGVRVDLTQRSGKGQHRGEDALALGRRQGTDIGLKALGEGNPHQALARRFPEAGFLAADFLSARTAISADLKVEEDFRSLSSLRRCQSRSA